jgi:hypothetical protein
MRRAPALNSALNLLEARARFEDPEQAVQVRLAEHNGHIYLDLADKTWRSVDVGPDGWRVVEEPPVRSRRPAGLLPLPIPQRGKEDLARETPFGGLNLLT